MFQETVKDNNKLIVQFCEKLSAATAFQEVCLKVTNLLFNSLKPSSPVKYDVYYSLVSLAGKVDQVRWQPVSFGHDIMSTASLDL